MSERMDYTGMSWSELERLVYAEGRNFTNIALGRLEHPEKVRRKIRQAFVTAFKKGETFDQLTARIQKIMNSEAYAARRIVQTEATRIESIAKQQAAEDIEAQTGRSIYKQWICTFQNSRDSHIFLHGSTVPLHDDFQAFGGPMQYPGDDSRVGPEEIINCRCYMIFHAR